MSSSNGAVEVPAEVSDEMMPGVVSLPHGWGHDKPGTRLSVAREHAGVNNNLLAPPDFVDVPSGNAAVNGIPVEVAPRLKSPQDWPLPENPGRSSLNFTVESSRNPGRTV